MEQAFSYILTMLAQLITKLASISWFMGYSLLTWLIAASFFTLTLGLIIYILSKTSGAIRTRMKYEYKEYRAGSDAAHRQRKIQNSIHKNGNGLLEKHKYLGGK